MSEITVLSSHPVAKRQRAMIDVPQRPALLGVPTDGPQSISLRPARSGEEGLVTLRWWNAPPSLIQTGLLIEVQAEKGAMLPTILTAGEVRSLVERLSEVLPSLVEGEARFGIVEEA